LSTIASPETSAVPLYASLFHNYRKMKLITPIVLGSISIASAAYTLEKDFDANSISFFDSFTFFTELDPTNGPVEVFSPSSPPLISDSTNNK
jgi:hypothetical protein